MNVRLQLFAAARQLAGRETIDVHVPPPGTIADLRRAAAEQFPVLVPLLAHAMFAVNTEYADDDSTIPAGAEVACIPPVSGG